MTEAVAPPRSKDTAPRVRWAACLVVMLCVHTGAAWLALRGVVTAPEQPPAAPEAVMLDLAPEPPPQPQSPQPQPPSPQPAPTPAPTTPPPPPIAQTAPESPPANQPSPPATEQPQAPEVAPPKPQDPAPAKTFAEPKPPLRHIPPKRPVHKAMVEHQPSKPVEQHEPEQAPAPSPPDRTAPPAAAAPATPASNVQPNWRSSLIGRLQQAKRYPAAARARDEQGVAIITFTMDRQGHVLSVALTRSSGSTALDEEAVALIHRAEPLPALPSEMHGDTITLTAPISFVLQ
jgi:periplasmic protein TonB